MVNTKMITSYRTAAVAPADPGALVLKFFRGTLRSFGQQSLGPDVERANSGLGSDDRSIPQYLTGRN